MISVLGVFNADLKFLVERFPKTGETLHANSFEVQPGGKGFNQAVACRRALGDEGAVSMLTQLGGDNFGEMARQVMEREEIDAAQVLTTDVMPTGTAMIMVEEQSADNMIVIAPGAASLLGEEEVGRFSRVITNSVLFMTNLEVPLVAAHAGLRIARISGTQTLLDPAPATKLPRELYQQLDFITPNESEAGILAGFEVTTLEDAAKAAKVLCSRGVGTAIVTMGALGVVAVTGDDIIVLPAFKLDKVVDTTGAGDAFNGSFAARITQGASLEDAIRFGSAGAALCVGKYGAADAMAQRSDIERFLQ